MELAKSPRPAESILSLTFDEATGVIAVTHALAPPHKLRSTLAYALTADEAHELAHGLSAFAAKPIP
jgi:hypothetical protein